MKRTEIYIAYKFLTSNYADKFISITRRFAFCGIVLGVATLIIVTSVMNGFRHEFMKNITGVNGQLTLKSSNGEINNYENLRSTLCGNADIKYARPIINEQSLILINNRYRGVIIIGAHVTDLVQQESIKIAAGTPSDDTIGVGEMMLKNMRKQVGDKITVFSSKPRETAFGQIPRSKVFKIGFSFSTGLYGYDSGMIIVPLHTAQKIFDYQDSVSDIQIILKQPELSKSVSAKVQNTLMNNGLYVLDWQESNKTFMNAVKIERNVMTIILALIILVAAFNIISCMVMLVKDKRKDIAILKTIGMTKESIVQIFLMCGSAIGVLGTTIGALLGVLLSLNLDAIKNILEHFTDSKLFSGEIYFLLELPCLIDVREVIVITFLSILLSILATIYPSLKAGRQSPVEILRYE